MRVAVTGGTGFLGSALCRALVADGHDLVVLTRDPDRTRRQLPGGARAVAWRTSDLGSVREAISGVDAILNLAGEPIAARRWSPGQKSRIRSSRLEGTRALVLGAAELARPPRVLVSASATGFYGPRGVERLSESAPAGRDFLAQVCSEWEAAALGATASGTRVVLLRIGVVLGRGGGALPRMLPPFRFFLGGHIGSGRQGFPWIHIDDVVEMCRWAIGNQAVSGPVNATGPELVDNRQFSEVLGRVLGRPCWLPVPAFALKLLLGELAEALLLQGQFVLPGRAQELGFAFRYPSVESALREILCASTGGAG